MRVAIVLFPGVEEMDFAGPLEVFGAAGKCGAGVEIVLVAAQDRLTCGTGLQLHGLAPLETVAGADWIVVPGGGWLGGKDAGVRAAISDGRILDALKHAHSQGSQLASVCTGAMALAHAGLLAGKNATTHHSALRDLEACGATIVNARIVDAGNIVTAGGVTSGIDLALWLLEREFGAGLEKSVEEYLEYERRGPIHRAV